MPSASALKFQQASWRAQLFLTTSVDRRLRPMGSVQVQAYLHASLAAFVAAWDAYLNGIVEDFFAEIANPLIPNFHAMHQISAGAARNSLKRFNTPNWENSRTLLLTCTGYDPLTDWVWTARKMNVLQVRERLDQTLKVRHSFAHGFSLPAYPWTQAASGQLRLTSRELKTTERFFANLVRRTDKGMAAYMGSVFGKSPAW
jgi:hypothetical protein